MPIDQNKFAESAVKGEVGYIGFLTDSALGTLSAALEKIARASGVDVAAELQSIQVDVDALKEASNKLTGWSPK